MGKALVSLTKPRVIELLLVTTVPVMIFVEQGLPSPWLLLETLAGGAGAWFLVLTVQLYRRSARGERKLREMTVFRASISYLTVLFLAIALDPFLR